MADPWKYGKREKTKLVTVRLPLDVYEKLERNHSSVGEYLRKRITYDVRRKHGANKKKNQS